MEGRHLYQGVGMKVKQNLDEPWLCCYKLMTVLLVLDVSQDFVVVVGAYSAVVMTMEHLSSIFS